MSDTSESNKNKPWNIAMWRQNTTWFVVFALIVCGVAWEWCHPQTHRLKSVTKRYWRPTNTEYTVPTHFIASYRSLVADSTISPFTAIVLNQVLTEASEALRQQETDQKTLHLLELEFAKIQDGYEVLNLWCALLSVVFLIFSFFSIFKANEMTRQGEDALAKFGQTAAEARQKSDSVTTQASENWQTMFRYIGLCRKLTQKFYIISESDKQ